MIKKCEVCNNSKLKSVLNLGEHPMCDDLIPIDVSRQCKLYKIEILYCEICKTAHQKYQIPKKDLFPKTYHYRSRFTKDVLNGMEDLVESYLKKYGSLKNKTVLDIGCNDGSLLNFFKKNGAITLGIEPTDAAKDAKKNNENIFQEYLSEELAKKIVLKFGQLDLITFTNVFAHIENLDNVLKSLKILMKESSILIIENHYLLSILDSNQFDTFYHEHPRSYSFNSFKKIVENLGAFISYCEFPSRYGGNIRVFCTFDKLNRIKTSEEYNIIKSEIDLEKKFLVMNNFINFWKKLKINEIKRLNKIHGPLNGKAFPGRAAILIKLLNLNSQNISCIYEKPESKKIDHYVPGTNIPISSDLDLFHNKDLNKPIVNFAWHISDEIKAYLRDNQFKGEIINIL